METKLTVPRDPGTEQLASQSPTDPIRADRVADGNDSNAIMRREVDAGGYGPHNRKRAHVADLLNACGPRASEVLTIVPLLINLLPGSIFHQASVALITLLIGRMGIGALLSRRDRNK
jgi:hypothetical protein